MSNTIRFICGWIRVMMKISKPGGVKTIAAENIALRQQLVTMARHHKRSLKLNPSDRIVFGLLASWINPKRLHKIAAWIKK